MTGRNFARKINIRFNCFGARTGRHCLEFLGPHPYFDLAPILGRFSGFIEPVRHNKNGDADAAATCEAVTANALLYFVCILRVAIVLVAREKNTPRWIARSSRSSRSAAFSPSLDAPSQQQTPGGPRALVKLIEGCVDDSTIEADRASRCAFTMCQEGPRSIPLLAGCRILTLYWPSPEVHKPR
jgi:hypothetical protein